MQFIGTQGKNDDRYLIADNDVEYVFMIHNALLVRQCMQMSKRIGATWEENEQRALKVIYPVFEKWKLAVARQC